MSPRPNPLLDTVKKVLEGQAPAAALEEKVVETRRSLEEMHADYQQKMQELTGFQLEATEEPRALVEEAFAAYGKALDLLSTGQEDDLFRGGDLALRSGELLESAFLGVRNGALVAAGPTDLPQLNLLLHALEEADRGPEGLETLTRVARQESALSQAARWRAARMPDLPERGAFDRALASHLELMEELAQAADAPARQALIPRLQPSFEALRDLGSALELAARAHGPTASPQVNLALALMRDLEGGLPVEAPLAETLQALAGQVEALRQSLATPPEEAPEAEVQEIRSAVEGCERAFQGFDDFLRSRDTLILKAARLALTEAADALHGAYQALQQIAEERTRVRCIRCSTPNDPGRSACSACGAVLPATARTSSSFEAFSGEEDPARRLDHGSPNLKRICEAARQAAEGLLGQEAFSGEVAWFEGLVEREATSMASIPAETPEAQEYWQGVEDLQQAVACFRDYLEGAGEECLVAGIRWCEAGGERLVHVQEGQG